MVGGADTVLVVVVCITWQDGHCIDWEGVKILDVASNHQERLVKEAVHILLSAPGLRMKGRRCSVSGRDP